MTILAFGKGSVRRGYYLCCSHSIDPRSFFKSPMRGLMRYKGRIFWLEMIHLLHNALILQGLLIILQKKIPIIPSLRFKIMYKLLSSDVSI